MILFILKENIHISYRFLIIIITIQNVKQAFQPESKPFE
jgi:hypothetical protein